MITKENSLMPEDKTLITGTSDSDDDEEDEDQSDEEEAPMFFV